MRIIIFYLIIASVGAVVSFADLFITGYKDGFYQTIEQEDLCVAPDLSVEEKLAIDKDYSDEPFVDKNRELKDIGTKFVNEQFFATKDALFNFMKLVYTTIDKVLDDYKATNSLPDNSMYLLFKGGNVLRMVSNEILDMLPEQLKEKLLDKYGEYFKRSDADFSVYIDEKLLNEKNYDQVLDEVTKKVFLSLGVLRVEMKNNQQKYFSFMRLDKDLAEESMEPFLEEANDINAITDGDNNNWYGAKFSQLQLLKSKAEEAISCDYVGQYDYSYTSGKGQILVNQLSNNTDWIVNTDNRTLTWTWGSDASKIVKFYLVRSKAYFDWTFIKDGKVGRKPIGGELIDVSIPHRDDDRLREFLDDYEQNVADYSIFDAQGNTINLKAYSFLELAYDLMFIIYDSFDRPWQGGGKYGKRLNRLFFLMMAEMMNNHGLGSDQFKNYLADVNNIVDKLQSIYPDPMSESAKSVVIQLEESVNNLVANNVGDSINNTFWLSLIDFMSSRLTKDPLDDDPEQFAQFVENIKDNLNVAQELANYEVTKKIDLNNIYDVELDNLF